MQTPFSSDTFCQTCIGMKKNCDEDVWRFNFSNLNVCRTLDLHQGWEVALVRVEVGCFTPNKIDSQPIHFATSEAEPWISATLPTIYFDTKHSLMNNFVKSLPQELKNKVRGWVDEKEKFIFEVEHGYSLIIEEGLARVFGLRKSSGPFLSFQLNGGRTMQSVPGEKKPNFVAIDTNICAASGRNSKLVSSLLTCNLYHFVSLYPPNPIYYDVTTSDLANIELSFNFLDTGEPIPILSSGPLFTAALHFRRRLPHIL